jgi:uroporphyrinogen-III synthase
MRVLVTRPRGAAERTAELLRARGHEAILSPLMEIRFVKGPEIPLDGIQAILATSANGVHALARRTERRDLPVFAVGAQTAAATEAVGFSNVKSADGDARTLAASVRKWSQPADGILLHAAGLDRGDDLARLLAGNGFEIKTEQLYEAVEIRSLSDDAFAHLRSRALDAVLLFSPRSARLFAERVQQAHLTEALAGVVAICISQARPSWKPSRLRLCRKSWLPTRMPAT